MNKKIEIKLPLPKNSKPYWTKQFQEFANRFNSDITQVNFYDNDEPSRPCIMLYKGLYGATLPLSFFSVGELLGYVQGFNAAKCKLDFSMYLEGAFKGVKPNWYYEQKQLTNGA